MSSKRHNRMLTQLARNYHAASSLTDDSVLSILHALDTPRSLTVWLLYNNKEHQQLVDLDIEPEDYNCPFRFRDDYTATLLLAKSDFFKLDVSKEEAAFKKFFKYEEQCRQTNNRFRNLALDPKYHGSNVWLLNATQRKIAEILGEYSPEEFIEYANWGPGVTTLTKGSHVSAVNKFHSENGITRDLYALVSPFFKEAYPLWYDHLTRETEEGWANHQVGNVIVTVPKNSKTDRVIAVEPGINLWFQKAIGEMIRRRLRRWGVNLNSQVLNQQLARQASKDARLATVDFSSASDSISRELIRELLPPRWFSLLNSTRSHLGTHNNETFRWEKFSSMGNGFTFELESLIFFAAALAVRDYLGEEGKINVFGDDVILPTTCYETFSSFSEFLGFTVNLDKSFSRSYFRESCGSHYFDGVDCKPVYLKERLSNVETIYKLANSVRWLAHRRNSHYGCDARFFNTWSHLFRRVPKPLRLRIPSTLGDSGFISNFDESTPAYSRHGIEGYYVDAMVSPGVTQEFDGEGLILARLHLLATRARLQERAQTSLPGYHESLKPRDAAEGGNCYTLRGQTTRKVVRPLVTQWYDLGPWI